METPEEANTPSSSSPLKSSSEHLTKEKVAFVEEKTKEMFAYTMECLDRLKTEGNNVLQWTFGVVVGGLGMTGTLFSQKYWQIATGPLAAAAWAAWIAVNLLKKLQSQQTMPPGNLAESLNTMLDDSEFRMRWREAKGLDTRIKHNLELGQRMAAGVDHARKRFALMPAFFVGAIIVGYLADALRLLCSWVFVTRY